MAPQQKWLFSPLFVSDMAKLMAAIESTLNFDENKVRKTPLVTFLLRRNVTRKFENVQFFFINFGGFPKVLRTQRVNQAPMKFFFFAKCYIYQLKHLLGVKLGQKENFKNIMEGSLTRCVRTTSIYVHTGDF